MAWRTALEWNRHSPVIPDEKADPQQAIQNLAGELRGVPDIRTPRLGMGERLAPVGPGA